MNKLLSFLNDLVYCNIDNKISSKQKNSIHITGASCIANFIIGSGKLIMGIFSLSIFTCVNAFYTYGIILAKFCIIYGVLNSKNIKEECIYYKYSGKILIIASVAYIIYSIKLVFFPVPTSFNKHIGLAIASFTFLEIGLNIRGIIIERKSKILLFHALKLINFASSCICLVLTQSAILSFTSVASGENHNFSANGYLGILTGAIATIIGIFIIKRGNKIIRKSSEK